MADISLKNETFYEVVATVIPLVAVVLLIQDRPWDSLINSLEKTLARAEKTLALLAFVLIAALALAEAAALDVLYNAQASLLNRVLIMVGLLAAALGLWVPLALNALLRFDEALVTSRPRTERSATIKIMTRDWQRTSVLIGSALIVILVAAAIWFFPHFWPA